MSGTKLLINDTGTYIHVRLDVRKGSNPQDHLKYVNVSLDAGQSQQVQYGDSQNPFLNGVAFEYKANGSLVEYDQEVIERGSPWDDTLNTNSKLTFHAVQEPITGSN